MALEGMGKMTENQKDSLQEVPEENVEENKEKDTAQASGSVLESLYDRLPNISIRALDRFIILCVIALILVILIGVLKANHIL